MKMHLFSPRKLCLMLLCSLLLAIACGDDSPIDELFIPNIDNAWSSSRGTTFVTSAETKDVNESDFTGNETDTNGDSFDLTGHFKNYDVNFTFTAGPESGVTYTGKFVKGSAPLKMNVKGSNGVSLTLTMFP